MNSTFRTIIGVCLSIVLLVWVMRDVSPAEVAREIGRADFGLLALSSTLTLGGLVIRAGRWGILLAPVHRPVPFRARFASIMIGVAANNVLPARIGELVRAVTLSRITNVGLPASLATLVVERVLDGLAVVTLLFVAISAPSFPAFEPVAGLDPRAAARFVALVMGSVAAALLLLVTAPDRSLRLFAALVRILPDRWARKLVSALESFLDGLAVLRNGRLMVVSLLLALGQWAFTAISFLVGFRAFGIDQVPYSGAVFLQSLVSLAVALPSSPGFFGPFEAAARVGLGLWAVPEEKAVSYAVGYHMGGFIPATLIGMYYFWRLGLSWREVRRA